MECKLGTWARGWGPSVSLRVRDLQRDCQYIPRYIRRNQPTKKVGRGPYISQGVLLTQD